MNFQVNNDFLARRPKSHVVLNDGLVVNDFTLSRPDSSLSLHSNDGDLNRSRSISPVIGRSIALTEGRAHSPKLSQSMDFERQARSQSPPRYLTNDYIRDDGQILF